MWGPHDLARGVRRDIAGRGAERGSLCIGRGAGKRGGGAMGKINLGLAKDRKWHSLRLGGQNKEGARERSWGTDIRGGGVC